MNINVPPAAAARLQSAVDFLKRILPQEGFKCAYIVQGERKWNQFFDTVEELAYFILQNDASGRTVYHACSAFTVGRNDPKGTPRAQRRLGRTHHNVLGTKAFWLDLDVGEGKPYATSEEAVDELQRVVKATELPAPLFVKSGYGLHVYWPLAEMLDPATWKRYAEGLQALCVKHGLHIDPTRTADISSVLRTPGTYNRKHGAVVPVSLNPRLLQVVQPLPLAAFATLLAVSSQGAAGGLGPVKSLAVLAGPLPPWLIKRSAGAAAKAGGTSADFLGGLGDYAPSYAADIVIKCGQIAALRDAPATVSEPLWHAALGVLAHCEDGEDLAHEWAAPEWHAAVDEKLERLESFGPTTCEKFSSLNAAGCEGCKYRGSIKSPITLGAKQPAAAEKILDEIDKVNARYFVVKIGGKSLIGEFVTPSGERRQLSLMSVEAFKTWHDNRKIAVRDHQGNERLKPLAKAWLEHPRRRQYEGLELDPSGPAELPNGCLNLWRGFGVEPKKGEWPLLARHVREVLANGDPEAAKYILRWTAWKLQHPGELAEAALVLRGGKGSGKGVFANTLMHIFGEHALHIFNQNHLTGNFNGHLRACLFLFADEAFWAGDKKGESVLKGLVTERMIAIEQKGVDVIPWRNRLGVLMAANADWVVPASHDERRFAVFDVSDRYAKNGSAEGERKSYFDALHNELQNGGAAAMLYDLLGWQLGGWHPRQIYETAGLRRQKEQSMPPIEQWFDEMLQDGRLPSLLGLPGQHSSKRFVQTRALIADAQLRVPRLSGYLTEKAIGDFLRRQGCTPVRSNSARGWQFPPLAQMREKWARRYDGRVWDVPDQEDWQ